MKISTQQLIQIAPMTDEARQEVLQKYPTLTSPQKFELEQRLWDSLGDLVDMRKQSRLTVLMEKAAQEGIEEQIDLDSIEEEVIAELLKKVDAHSTSEELTNVHQELQQFQQPSPAPMQQHTMQPPQTPLAASAPAQESNQAPAQQPDTVGRS